MNTYFAINFPNLNPDPDVNSIYAVLLLLLLLVTLVMSVRYSVPLAVNYYREQQAQKEKAKTDFWFDENKSILHRGNYELTIPDNSLEYHVCKLVFINPKVYTTDWDILQAAGEEDKKDRAVYFAVDRINNKAKGALKLESKLLKRSKESTRLNDNYF